MFEEEYRKLAKSEEYQTLFEMVLISMLEADESCTNGYLSIDKKGGGRRQMRTTRQNRDNADVAYT